MIGLTWGDAQLHLTPLQWGVILFNTAAWLWQWRTQANHTLLALVMCGALYLAFWNDPAGRDTALLFEQAGKLQPLSWSAFLDTFYKRPYLEFQTPFYPFFISRVPELWRQQLSCFPSSLLTVFLLFAVFGRHAALICATPLLAIMLTQPSTDLWLLVAVLCTQRLMQLRCLLAAAVVYGVSWLIKPLVLITLPFIAWRLGGWGILAMACWLGYVLLSLHWPFGQHQVIFLFQQLLIKPLNAPTMSGVLLQHTLFWRWHHIGQQTLLALPWYLFPVYCSRWSWMGWGILGIILGGYGNVKYVLLLFPFLFEVVDDVNHAIPSGIPA